MRRWFLSYHSPDQALAERLKTALERKDTDARVFFAPSSLRAGGFWSRALAEEIAQADVFILLVGEKGVGDWQELEYDEALDKRVKFADFPIILVLLERQTAPSLPFLRRLHWIITSDPSSEKDVARLFDAAAGTGTRLGELWRYTQPYRGLAAMEEKDSDYFFGRGQETVDVLSALAAAPDRLPILLGNSGVGKSSLAKAGVLAALKRQAWPERARAPGAWPHAFGESRRWCFLTFKPGPEPLKALVESFLDTWQLGATDPERVKQQNGWIELLRDGKVVLRDLLDATERRYKELDRTEPPAFLLYVDQGEELYVRAEERQRRRFSELIALGVSDQRLYVLMSMRTDFLGELQKDEPLYTVHRQINVPPLREAELREVVSRPAELLSARFETAALVEIITRRTVEDSVKDVGALPLLSYTLDDMWTQMVKRDDGVLRLSAQSFELGGVLVDRADAFLADHPKSENQLRRIFTLKLATVQEGEEPTRRRALRSEFTDEEWRLVSELADHPNRLLVTATPESGDTYAEVAHEAIFRRWDKLREWTTAERDFLVWKSELQSDRRKWENAPDQARTGALLMGLALVQAQSWLAKRAEDLPSIDRDFIAHSVHAEAARHEAALQLEIRQAQAEQELARFRAEKEATQQRERAETEERARLKAELTAAQEGARARQASQRAARLAVMTAVLLAMVAGLAAFQWRQARVEGARAMRERDATLVTQSRFVADLSRQALRKGESSTAILLALEALPDAERDRPTVPEAEQVLRLSLSLPTTIREFRGGLRASRSATVSPDETMITTASDDRKVRLWDFSTGMLVKTIEGHLDAITSAAFSPDGKRLVTASYDGTARLWDWSSGKPIGVPMQNGAAVWGAVFSPDGNLVLTASEDHTARIWESNTGRAISNFRHAASVNSAAFSPDGNRVATASDDRTARIWEVSSGRLVAVLAGHTDTIEDVSFSFDGLRVVTASADKTAIIWSVSGHEAQIIFRGHLDKVSTATFSRDGSRILTASRDGTARIWDGTSGEPISILGGAYGTVYSASFTPDGKKVITSHEDGIIRLRSINYIPSGSTEYLISYAKQVVLQCLNFTGRKAAFLNPEPPAWCIEMAKRPYNTSEWSKWLVDRKKGKAGELPSAP